ncbi:hypothetical protein HG536_0A01190 [Torulaspora globosa]|uniref:SPX domain-containing protein n=1 Tax=Torulaspora globosa TaxID=48254 RepID=A0A7G3Z9W6_9SACH|nr:uncharacterized protein HG536_0A01190 [Torulaspora globosa]QLL30302.1 hypothetical protein HG536_0A01190 [Torulaspora globosa]
MKFGKYLEARQLELPEYNSHFIDYKALKKLIKQLAVPLTQASSTDHLTLDDIDESTIYQRLQENKASFFFKLERELEKVNSYYLEKESDLKIIFDILQTKFNSYRERGQLSSKKSVSYGNILSGFKKFQRDLGNLEQFIELNRTGFAKVLKKWDKRSHSHQKEFYLATVVVVQPIFTSSEVSKLNDATLGILDQLDGVSKEDAPDSYGSEINRRSTNTPIGFIPSPTSRLSCQQLIVGPNTPVVLDLDIEIENWFLEIVNISKLRDENKKFSLLKEFFMTKMKDVIDDAIPQSRIDKGVVLKDCLTRLFLLLVGSSTIDDVSLHVFYTSTRNNIDLSYCDESDQVFSRRNVFHEAGNCSSHSRIFVLREALIMTSAMQSGDLPFLKKDNLKVLLNAQDLYSRTPLHYAAELGKLEFVKLLISSNLLESVDVLDNHSQTPLILAIINNHTEVVRELLVNGHAAAFPDVDEFSKPQFAPLIVACYHKNYGIAKMILEQGHALSPKLSDAKGLGTLHIVAKEGGPAELIELLVRHGADPNGVDNFNVWTPIFYAIQEGHAETVKVLLKYGARLDITDEHGLGPLYYAIWESHVDVLNVLMENLTIIQNGKEPVNYLPIMTTKPRSPSSSLQDIPDFALPPPIIPLRKYGHNFLEKKIFVKLIMKPGNGSIQFLKEDEMILSSPGRITLTSNLAEIIPRNIILPISEEEEREVAFQVDSIENFAIDFEIFPAYGTRIIAKTTAMPNLFNLEMANGTSSTSLPLFDTKLTNVGTLTFDYQVIMPYNQRPLEITKYEPYWKSTTGTDVDPGKEGQQIVASSLSGSFITVMVRWLRDGTIIVARRPYIVTNNVKIFLCDLTRQQLEELRGYKLDDVMFIDNEQTLKNYLSTMICTLSDLLEKVPPSIQLEIQVCFPTNLEIDTVPLNISPLLDLNKFVDQILFHIFEHVRRLRHSGQSVRPVVFSSCNWQACTVLNWKQPNFPVLYHMNDLRKVNDQFVRDTPHNLKDLALDPSKVTFADGRSKCLHEIVSFAVNNNLLGISLPYELLTICKTLIDAIRGHGLLLIGARLPGDEGALNSAGVNGIHMSSELVFSESVEM